mgnify:CR=1 FL=1|tara:strand:- start:264 stop:665 length:402 start_codon:yes stop_codon:yes gene_type:complete
MLNPNDTNGEKRQNEEQLSISDGSTHDNKYPFLTEFSDLISNLSIKELKPLLTHQQRMFATALWEAENYGGSIEKCKKRLKELHGPNWHHVVSIKDHMADICEYYRLVLLIDHKIQWDKYKNSAKITSDKVLE